MTAETWRQVLRRNSGKFVGGLPRLLCSNTFGDASTGGDKIVFAATQLAGTERTERAIRRRSPCHVCAVPAAVGRAREVD